MKFSSILLTSSLLVSTATAFVVSPAQTTDSTFTTTRLDATASRREILSGTAAAAALVVAGIPLESHAEPRPMYLKEPTAEFKANEAKAADFKRKQLEQKKKFNDALDKLVNEPDDEDALEKDLIDLRRLVVETQGMPAGIKKEDMYKIVRTKKAKGFWPTKVEIA